MKLKGFGAASQRNGITQKSPKSLVFQTAFSTRGFDNAQRLFREEHHRAADAPEESVECA